MKKDYCSMAIVLSLALTATGCKQQEAKEQLPVRVKVMRMEPVGTDGGRHYSGTVEESSGSTLSFPVSGTVRQVCVEAGQRVEKGQLIAVLDEATLQSACDAATATLEQAEDAWRRMKQLHDAGSLPEMQWVEVQSKLKQAEAAERTARKNLADGRLYAPFSGVIAGKQVETGHNVMPGTPVVRLVTVSQVKVSISVPENEIQHVRTGQAVNVSVSASGGKNFSGKVVEKGIVAHPLSRSYEVKALVDNPAGELMPGMIGTLSIVPEEAATVLLLPPHIVQTDEANRTFVWTNQQGKARKRLIETGTLERNGVTVTAGLSAGDEVLVEGQQKVSEGMDIVASPLPLSRGEGFRMPRKESTDNSDNYAINKANHSPLLGRGVRGEAGRSWGGDL